MCSGRSSMYAVSCTSGACSSRSEAAGERWRLRAGWPPQAAQCTAVPPVGQKWSPRPHHPQPPLLTGSPSAAPGPTAPAPAATTARSPRGCSLSEQMTPAAKRVPVFLQFRLLPWCWQWLRDSSWPAHFTPLSTISVTLLASQYHVSWGGGEGRAGRHACCSTPSLCTHTPTATPSHGMYQPHPIAPWLSGKHEGHHTAPHRTYRHRVQGVAQAQLATDHHRLLGGPAVAAHSAPLTAALHLHAALELCPPPGQADLREALGPSAPHTAPYHPAPPSPPHPRPRRAMVLLFRLPGRAGSGTYL